MMNRSLMISRFVGPVLGLGALAGLTIAWAQNPLNVAGKFVCQSLVPHNTEPKHEGFIGYRVNAIAGNAGRTAYEIKPVFEFAGKGTWNSSFTITLNRNGVANPDSTATIPTPVKPGIEVAIPTSPAWTVSQAGKRPPVFTITSNLKGSVACPVVLRQPLQVTPIEATKN